MIETELLHLTTRAFMTNIYGGGASVALVTLPRPVLHAGRTIWLAKAANETRWAKGVPA